MKFPNLFQFLFIRNINNINFNNSRRPNRNVLKTQLNDTEKPIKKETTNLADTIPAEFTSSRALVNIVQNSFNNTENPQDFPNKSLKRASENDTCPLDLSSSQSTKRTKVDENNQNNNQNNHHFIGDDSNRNQKPKSLEDIRCWSVEDVYNFVKSIDSCSEYAEVRLKYDFLQ